VTLMAPPFDSERADSARLPPAWKEGSHGASRLPYATCTPGGWGLRLLRPDPMIDRRTFLVATGTVFLAAPCAAEAVPSAPGVTASESGSLRAHSPVGVLMRMR